MTLTLHHLEYSQSFRIVWLLEEIGMDYAIKVYKRTAELKAPPEYKAISPLGVSPTITEGAIALSESNTIIEYILDKADREGIVAASQMRPAAGSPERNDYLFWFHASPGSFQLVMSTDSLFRILPTRVPWPLSIFMTMIAAKVHASFLDPRLTAILQLAEKQLAANAFLAGSFLTAADITSIYSFDAAFTRMPELKEDYPACNEWLERMGDREAFQEALHHKIGQESISLKLE